MPLKMTFLVIPTILALSIAVIILSAVPSTSAPIEPRLPMTFQTSLRAGDFYNFTFSIYNGAGPTARRLWHEGPVALKVQSDKTIKHMLGSIRSFGTAVTFSQQLWVQVTGGGMTQRVKLGVVPYAIYSLNPGPQGPKGDQGPQGIQGVQGPQGERGVQGEQGLQGERGLQGEQGTPGLKGDKGDPGAKGDAGVPGADGATVLNGTADPDPAAGKNGDFYLNTGMATMFGPKAGGEWGIGTALVGSQGPIGPQGTSGTGIAFGSLDATVCNGANNGFTWFDPADDTLKTCKNRHIAKYVVMDKTMEQVVAHRIFVTSNGWAGNLGGLSGADSLCNQAASSGSQTAPMAASWIALISDSSTNARDRVSISGEVRRIDGRLVAMNSSDLWDGSIGSPIYLTEDGYSVSGGDVATGSTSTGTTGGSNCSNWTTSSSNATGHIGFPNNHDVTWFGNINFHQCNLIFHLYCISTEPVAGLIQY